MSVDTSKKPEKIKSIFSSVAPNYDKANDILSLGIHKRWKKMLVSATMRESGKHLDLATGTGDVAFLYEAKARRKGGDDENAKTIVGADFSAEMLSVAKEKKATKNSQIDFVEADILDLPFKDQEFSSASFAFGVRNVKDVDLALKEIKRVLSPGATLGILEFGRPQERGLWDRFFGAYQTHVLPVVGGWVTGDSDAYRYLDQSSKEFPSGEEFADKMKHAGFSKVDFRALSGGIAYLYTGTV
jgi:demethylmenaquinone methyltransferase/2-methoxy-6-polyprenyl-1,4-benzoquinol methylase